MGAVLATGSRKHYKKNSASMTAATAFKACLKENDIEAPKGDMDKHGAIGRFRMCAGLMLCSAAKKTGYVVINGKKITGAKKPREKKRQTRPHDCAERSAN